MTLQIVSKLVIGSDWLAQDNSKVVPALVLSLRSNGFIGYVPEFDAKGPVYLCDRDGLVNVSALWEGCRLSSIQPVGQCERAVKQSRLKCSGKAQITLHWAEFAYLSPHLTNSGNRNNYQVVLFQSPTSALKS